MHCEQKLVNFALSEIFKLLPFTTEYTSPVNNNNKKILSQTERYETNVNKNAIEFLFCWSSTAGHGVMVSIFYGFYVYICVCVSFNFSFYVVYFLFYYIFSKGKEKQKEGMQLEQWGGIWNELGEGKAWSKYSAKIFSIKKYHTKDLVWILHKKVFEALHLFRCSSRYLNLTLRKCRTNLQLIFRPISKKST